MGMIKTIEAAIDWFLNHATGSVRCQRPDGKEKVCESYPDAKKFFAEVV